MRTRDETVNINHKQIDHRHHDDSPPCAAGARATVHCHGVIIIIPWYISIPARCGSRLSAADNRSVIVPRYNIILLYLHLNEIAFHRRRSGNTILLLYYIGRVSGFVNNNNIIIIFVLRSPCPKRILCTGPVTRENTSDAIFQSIGFHGPKLVRVMIITV